MIHPLAILPIILTIGCIALICAVLTIDAIDRKLADDALGDDPNGLPRPNVGASTPAVPSFHATLINPEAQRDHGDQ